jgi:hypothetical protein
MSSRTQAATQRGRLALLAAALAVSGGALFLEAGRLGALVAVISVGVAIATTGVLGVATLHLGVLALVNPPTVVGLVLLETASGFLLVAETPPSRRLETGALFVPVSVVLAVVILTVAEQASLAAGATVLIGTVAVGAYLVHRYARVRLGLAAGELDA